MTRDEYLDMCDQLGSEPLEEEIPWDLKNFPDLVQTCFLIYSKLPDIFDSMNGNFFGKDYTIVFKLFVLYYIEDLEEQRLCMDIFKVMDSSRAVIIANKKASAKK